MALQSSGAISLANIQTEFGGSNPIGMSEYYRGGANVTSNNTSVPASGAIDMADFYGTSNLQSWETTDVFGDGSGKFLYRLNNTLNESTGAFNAMVKFAGSGNPAYTTNTPNTNKISHAFNHTTSGAKIQVSGLNFSNDNSHSLSFWIRHQDTNSDAFFMQYWNGSTSNAGRNNITVSNHGNNFGSWPYNTSSGANFIQISSGTTNSLFNNTWKHVVWTWNDNGWQSNCYINKSSASISQLNGNNRSLRTNTYFRIGQRGDNQTNNNKNFEICQIRAFNKRLSQSEVNTLYHEIADNP